MNSLFTHICSVAALLLATLLPSACADDDILDPAAGQYTDRICFTTTAPAFEPDTRSSRPADCFMLRSESGQDSLYVNATVCDFETSDSPATRAPLTTTSTLTSFKVSAYAKNNGAWTTFFHEEENTRTDASSPWTYASGRKHYWPGAEHPMRFCAYSPSSALGLTVNPSMTDGVANTISLSVNDAVPNQVDLLVAKADEVPGDYYSAYPLSFSHACTAVQFREGPGIQPGTVQKIELVGVNYEGTFSLETMSWTLDDTQVRTFNQNVAGNGKDVPDASGNTDITNDTDCFIMLPQTLPDGAQLRINFKDKVTGQERVLTAPLDGKTWPQGKKIVYTLSITPGYNFEFVETPSPIDAHYDIIYKTLRVTGVPDGDPWTIKTSLSAGTEQATIQLQSEMNEYAKMGYWLDRRVDSNGNDQGSARGETTFKGFGSGDFQIAIFVPENMTGSTRDVKFEVTFDRSNGAPDGSDLLAQTLTLQQLSPAPASGGSFGWEQIDDNERGEFGFCWNARYMYLIPYQPGNIQDKAHELSETLIDKYQASAFVNNKNVTIRINSFPSYRQTWITIIDYSRLNVSTVQFQNNNGLFNTQEIIKLGRGAFSKLFQNALTRLTKENAGETDDTSGEKLYRAPSDWEISNTRNQRLTFENWETQHEGSPSGLFVLRHDGPLQEPGTSVWSYLGIRNSYNLTQSTTITGAYVWTPTLNELKWYLPARDQFNSLPTTVASPIIPSEYWSSTPVQTTLNAYTGSKAQESRANKHKVRACRNLP